MIAVDTPMLEPSSIAESLRAAARSLDGRSDSPRLDAEVLLGALLGAPRSALVLRAEETLSADTGRNFRELIARRAGGEPVAYLTGIREFWSLPLKVTPAVLVPRPETELLVEQALALLPAGEGRTAILDLGTGSGAIALALAVEHPGAHIVGIDVSEAAIRVARENAVSLGLERIEFAAGSWFAAVPGRRFDLIVSNPPYIAADDPALASLRAEPAGALIGGPTGLEQLEAIIAVAPAHLTAGGWLLVEHGATQAAEVAELFGRYRFEDLASQQDYSGRPRLTRGRHHGPTPSPPAFNQEST